MSRADDARPRVAEQHHAAIGAGHAQRKARCRRRERIAARTLRPGFGDGQAVRRMDLVGHQQAIGRDAERGGHARPVLGNVRGRIARPDAPVQRRVIARADAAFAREKGMPRAASGKEC